MATALLAIIGLIMIYTWIHSVLLFFKKDYKDRTTYEKVVSIVAMITLTLFIIGQF